MKYIFTFLTIFISCSLFAKLDKEKMWEAFANANLNPTENTFFYKLTEDPIAQPVETNESFPEKIYGPYQLILKGIPPSTRFTVYQCNLLGVYNPLFFGTGYIDQDGEAWFKKIEKDIQKERYIKLANCLQFAGGMLPGEPLFSLVILDDEKTYLAASLIPKPLEVYGENGCHVSMKLFTHHKACYCLLGEKFQPNEEITLSVHSQKGIVVEKLRATQTGSFSAILEGIPSKNELLETEHIQISAASQRNPMTLFYDWQFLKAGNGIWMRNKKIAIIDRNKA